MGFVQEKLDNYNKDDGIKEWRTNSKDDERQAENTVGMVEGQTG